MSTIKLFCFATHIHKLFFSNLPEIRITRWYGRILSKKAKIRIGYGQSVPGGMSATLTHQIRIVEKSPCLLSVDDLWIRPPPPFGNKQCVPELGRQRQRKRRRPVNEPLWTVKHSCRKRHLARIETAYPIRNSSMLLHLLTGGRLRHAIVIRSSTERSAFPLSIIVRSSIPNLCQGKGQINKCAEQ